MNRKVLVAYASLCGSTAEIAEAAGQVLAAQGADVRVCDVADITTLDEYDAILLGTAIRMGRPVKPMRDFIRNHAHEVASRPNAVFSVGATPRDRTPRAISEASHFVSPVVSAVAPLSVALFAGKIDPTRLALPWRALIEHAEPGSRLSAGDWRDWDAIDAWVEEIAPQLLAGGWGARGTSMPS
ncbi:MAG: flavodoxin domain-containing protein [Coriobacteriia bacterium]|nr:flavodoxin domain-containing protein [Coriobacteriia bacterium]